MFADHAFPGRGIPILKGKSLPVRSIRQQRRAGIPIDGTKNISPKNNAIIHQDRHVPVDAHAIANFAFVLQPVAPICMADAADSLLIPSPSAGFTCRVRCAVGIRRQVGGDAVITSRANLRGALRGLTINPNTHRHHKAGGDRFGTEWSVADR